MNYRPEIDGLRAIAVLPVILFHAGAPAFSGGYVGVDIFFVISGFLITSIVLRDLDERKFSLRQFYERRARRILPALYLVMAVCLICAWLFLPPTKMKDFMQSIVATTIFMSNILFYSESGYFDSLVDQKPLLHTWSLSVEEQFYVIFPLLLVLLWRRNRNVTLVVLFLLGSVSLALSEVTQPVDSALNFYLLHTRIWELLVGAISAGVVYQKPVKKNDLLACIGLFALGISIFIFDEQTPFPSLYTLLPVIATALILVFAQTGSWVARVLAIKSLVFLGLISYSAYLWHQPLFAFARVVYGTEPVLWIMLSLAFISLGLAWSTYRFVERPFRDPSVVSTTRVVRVAALMSIAFIVIGALGIRLNGFEQKISLPTDQMMDRQIMVLGDSHAGHLVSGLSRVNAGPVIDLSSPGCIPLRGVDRYDDRFEPGACFVSMSAALDRAIAQETPTVVLLSTMGPVYLDGTTFMGADPSRVMGLEVRLMSDPTLEDHYAIFENGLRQTFFELLQNPNLTVVFAIDVPEIGFVNGCGEPAKRISIGPIQISDLTYLINDSAQTCLVSREQYDARAGRYREIIHSVSKDFQEVLIFDPTSSFCDSNACYGYREGYGYIYRDADHLNENGSLFYAQNFANFLMLRN